MMNWFRTGISRIAALGAVVRRGVGGLKAYGGTVQGSGHVIRKETGEKVEFTLNGTVGSPTDSHQPV